MDLDKIIYQAEASAVRLERTISRLWILLIIMLVLLVGTNVAWICYDQQFEDTVATIDAQQDGAGINMVGGGNVSYGAESQDNN